METEIKEIKRLATETHTAVVGNEDLGHRGLVKRVKCLEQYKSRLIVWTATAVGGGAVLLWVANMVIPHLFK